VSEIITRDNLNKLVDEWIAQGRRVAGPAAVGTGRIMFAPLTSAAQMKLEGYVRAENSIKEFLFPKSEKLYGYKFEGQQIDLVDWEVGTEPRLILGARPCDAAALPILDHVFNWDTKDEFYNKRRQATTIVSMACTEHDAQCFCTSVGLAPDSEKGADALLLPVGDGAYEVRCVTEKGKALFAGKTQAGDRAAQLPAGPAKKFEAGKVREYLEKHFEDPLWEEATLRCLGCGACAYNCPTCHCFDIVDEGNAKEGCRVKNWDACQFSMFTLHASGHNPRACQAHRQRQRIQHKFRIYPEKFGETLCTGCGNCTRNCPVSLGVMSVLEPIQKLIIQQGEK
jgi:ferredoxin